MRFTYFGGCRDGERLLNNCMPIDFRLDHTLSNLNFGGRLGYRLYIDPFIIVGRSFRLRLSQLVSHDEVNTPRGRHRRWYTTYRGRHLLRRRSLERYLGSRFHGRRVEELLLDIS